MIAELPINVGNPSLEPEAGIVVTIDQQHCVEVHRVDVPAGVQPRGDPGELDTGIEALEAERVEVTLGLVRAVHRAGRQDIVELQGHIDVPEVALRKIEVEPILGPDIAATNYPRLVQMDEKGPTQWVGFTE